jgi:cytochrome c-type biogenesis protein CcmF
MLADFGFGVLIVTFLVALYSAIAAVLGERKQSSHMVESARRAQLLTFPLLSLASLVLIYLLVNNHFDVSFVYEVTSRSMPTYLKITAWWGGQAGSLLFWAWLLSAFTSAVTLRKWERDREFLPWVIVVSSVTLAFFLSMNIFFENPFGRFYQIAGGVASYTFKPAGGMLVTPQDGQGLNPLLRHPGMIIHPPMLYLGFVSFVIPFAFAIAALVTGRTDDRWTRITRRWTLWAWLFLSLGLVLGGRWAYDVLGWGGYWGWDPVEIAAFMPWLTGTAFLHSVMIQEHKSLLKHWNMILIMLTYALVIFGTFLTRSGVLSSVHAFAQSAIGPMFFAFIGLTFITSVALLIWRWPELKSETEMKSMLSREAFFLLNNLLFLSVLVVCFWGVIFPLISELFTGQKVTVGPPFYERANGTAVRRDDGADGHRPAFGLGQINHADPRTRTVEADHPGAVCARAGLHGRLYSTGGIDRFFPGGFCYLCHVIRYISRGSRTPTRTERELLYCPRAPGRTEPPALWRLHHPH